MSDILREPWIESVIEYSLIFDDGHGNGLSFPCDEHGNLFDDLSDAAKQNFQWAMHNPEKFARFGKVEKRTYSIHHGPTLKCDCGEEFELYNGYLGACECPKCDQWYNVFGQHLKNPEHWEV